MRFLSLFSGMGGFDNGLEMAGMECAGQVEIDKDCLRVLEHHWPDVRRWTDVRDINADTVGRTDEAHPRRSGASADSLHERRQGRPEDAVCIDLICGGFPCQDVSVAGKRAGLDGARSGLWFEFHRIVRELRPKYVLVENVPGLLSSNQGRDFAIILDGLADLGFGVSWRVLDSRYFGVAQRRRRVFIVAGPTVERTEAILALAEGCAGHPETGRAAGEDVAGTLGGGAGERGWPDDTDRMTFVPEISPTAEAHWAKHGNAEGGHSPLIAVRPANTGANGHGIADDVAHTIDGGTGFAAVQGVSVRRLTPTECLRLQAFPDNWLDLEPQLSDGSKYRMCGNAVTVSVIQWIGERIMAAELTGGDA